MMRLAYLLSGILALSITAVALRAQEADAGDGTRISGTLSFTCNPDEKSKQAGATPFEDTLELGNDRVKSKALSAEGFPAALSIPRTVNGVVTFRVTFKKKGAPATAVYFIRAKPDGAVSGSLTRRDGAKTLRYTIGATSAREAAEADRQEPAPQAALDPAVLRVNGGFVRLLSAQIAIAEAGVKPDKSKVNALLKSAGNDQNTLRVALLKGTLQPEDYVKQAEARLAEARQSLATLLGEDAAAKVEQAYDKPYTSAYLYLNQMRAAVAELGADKAAKQADAAVYQQLVELAVLGRQPSKRTPEAIEKIKQQARADVLKALGEPEREKFEKTLAGLTSQ